MYILKLHLSNIYIKHSIVFWCIPSLMIVSMITSTILSAPSMHTKETRSVKVALYQHRIKSTSRSIQSELTSASQMHVRNDLEITTNSAEETTQYHSIEVTNENTDSLIPAKIDFKKPVYPQISKRLGEEGDVYAAVTIDESDTIVSIIIERSSGYSRLDKAVLDTLKHAHVQAQVVNGHKKAETLRLGPFRFRIIESD